MYGDRKTRVSRKIKDLPFSRIRKKFRLVNRLAGVIPSWFGKLEVNTSEFIRDSAKNALDRRETFYTPNSGLWSLSVTIAKYMSGLYKTPFNTSHITVSGSGMNAFTIVAQFLISPGSRVVVLSPSWQNIPAAHKILGPEITQVPINLSPQGWTLDLVRLLKSCEEKTSLIVINSPNNPSGWMIKREDQKFILELSIKRGLWIVNDEVYARIIYGHTHATFFLEVMKLGDRVIVVNSFSKLWVLTGWRLGWVTAPKEIEKQIEKLTEYNISDTLAFVEPGIMAIKEGEKFSHERTDGCLKLRNLFDKWAYNQLRLVYASPKAAFYAIFEIKEPANSLSLAKDLLKQKGIGLASGCAFGSEYDSFLCFC